MDEQELEVSRRLKDFIVDLMVVCSKHGIHIENELDLSNRKSELGPINVFSDFEGFHHVSASNSYGYYTRVLSMSPSEIDSLVSEKRLRDKAVVKASRPSRGGL